MRHDLHRKRITSLEEQSGESRVGLLKGEVTTDIKARKCIKSRFQYGNNQRKIDC